MAATPRSRTPVTPTAAVDQTPLSPTARSRTPVSPTRSCGGAEATPLEELTVDAVLAAVDDSGKTLRYARGAAAMPPRGPGGNAYLHDLAPPHARCREGPRRRLAGKARTSNQYADAMAQAVADALASCPSIKTLE